MMRDSVRKTSGWIAGWAGKVLFPPVCLACENQIALPGSLCVECWPKLRFLERPWCAVMGTPFSVDMGPDILSAEAIADPPPFARARAAVVYEGVARRLVLALKFGDRTDLAPWMARWMVRVGSELMGDAQLVIPVPLHRRRFLVRRFNQAAELGRHVARSGPLAFAPEALQRKRQTASQPGLTAVARHSNVRGAFIVPDTRRSLVYGRRVLLIDDVYTTGATVMAAARTLRRAGAADVDVLTFARVLPGDFRAGNEHLI